MGGGTGERRPGLEVVIESRCELMKAFNRMAVGPELMRWVHM